MSRTVGTGDGHARVKAASKEFIRRAVRSRGYDLVPFVAGFGVVQQDALSRVDVLVDVGANVGQYARRARSLGFSGDIISFEPTAAAYKILENGANRDPKWTTRKLALGAQAGTALINVSKNSVSSSILEVGRSHLEAAPASRIASRESITVATLDEALHAIPGRKYLKIDVQGYELEVLRGASEVLRDVHFIQLELSFSELYSGQPTWLEVSATVERAGYGVWHVEPGHVDRATNRMLQCDVLFVREPH